MSKLSNYNKSITLMIISQIFTIMTTDIMERYDIYEFDQLWDPAKNSSNIKDRLNYMHTEFLYSFIYKFFKDAQTNSEKADELLKNMKKINNFEEFNQYYSEDFRKYFEENLTNKINVANIQKTKKQTLLYKYNVYNMKNNKKEIINDYNFAVGLIKEFNLLKVLPKIPLIINKLL